MNDHIKSEISSYLAGGLTESRNRQIEAHVAACEKCRNALTKARSKQARVKREALKRAAADPLPNLFLARQGKDQDHAPSSTHTLWITGILLLLLVGGFWYYRSMKATPLVEPTESSETPLSDATPTPEAPVPKAPSTPATPPAVVVPKVLAALQFWSGSESAFKDPKVVVVRNNEAWKRLQGDAQLATPLPDLDFEKKIVIGIFAGPRPAGTQVALDKIEESDDGMYAPYAVSAPPVQVSTSTAPGTVTHPYLLTVFPRVDKKIKVFSKE